MSSRHYHQQSHQQQRYHSQSHRTAGGQNRWVARRATTTAAESNPNATSTSTSTATAAVTTAAAAARAIAAITATPQPAALDRIANLLNLAQNLMSSVKEQQRRKQQQQQRSRAERHTTRRNVRLQALAPYQRLATESHRTRHSNGSATADLQSNANTNSILSSSGRLNSSDAGNGRGSAIANGGQLNETQFCSCAECSARKLRSEIVVANGDRSFTDAATPTRAANTNYMQHHNYNGSGSSNYNNNSCHTSANFQCSICLESYLQQRPMATQCGHIFCRLCILKCVSCQGKCPICNRKLNLTNVFRVFF